MADDDEWITNIWLAGTNGRLETTIKFKLHYKFTKKTGEADDVEMIEE
jgi:hypothetical protein